MASTSPTEFLDPIYEPGVKAFARESMELVDAAARVSALKVIATNKSPAELRSYADKCERDGLGWLASINRDLAANIELDARLEVLTCMEANARGSTYTFVRELTKAILRAHAQRAKVAA